MNWQSFLTNLNRARVAPAAVAPVAKPLPFSAAAARAAEQADRVTRAMSDSNAVDVVATLPPGDDGEKTIEKRIIEGLDAGALVFLEILKDTSKDDSGSYRIDAKTRQDAFKQVSDYLVKRQKAGANDAGDGMPPYEKIRKQLDAMGFMIVPKPKPGRPSKEEIELRKEVLGDDAPDEPPAKPVSDDEDLRKRLNELAQKRPGAATNGQG